MRVRIEQDYYGEEVTLGELEAFVDAVRASIGDLPHPGLATVEITSTKLVYEREK